VSESRTLPPDDHVHSEWSWDAVNGSMDGSCAKAVELGLPSIAFTEHVDRSRWRGRGQLPGTKERMERQGLGTLYERLVANTGPDGRFTPPALDVDGYLESIARCRQRYPGLRIVTGVELGEPHWFQEQTQALLATGAFERVLGSQHSLGSGDDVGEVGRFYAEFGPDETVRAYLAEMLRMVETSDAFAVLAHVDYAIRYWPESAGPHDPTVFEEEYRAVLRALAQSGRTLEVNMRLPLHPQIVRWWHELGGETVSFGSDAHNPVLVAREFAQVAAMVEAQGFQPGRAPHDFWTRGVTRR
jgi:histidinol-phosphatase (PHP family)